MPKQGGGVGRGAAAEAADRGRAHRSLPQSEWPSLLLAPLGCWETVPPEHRALERPRAICQTPLPRSSSLFVGPSSPATKQRSACSAPPQYLPDVKRLQAPGGSGAAGRDGAAETVGEGDPPGRYARARPPTRRSRPTKIG